MLKNITVLWPPHCSCRVIFSRLLWLLYLCVIAHIQSRDLLCWVWHCPRAVVLSHTKNYLLRDHMRVIIPLFNNSHMSVVVYYGEHGLMCSCICCAGGTTLLSHCYLYHKEWDSSSLLSYKLNVHGLYLLLVAADAVQLTCRMKPMIHVLCLVSKQQHKNLVSFRIIEM